MGRAAIAPIIPASAWPDGDRQAWELRAPPSWTPEYAAQIRREYGRLLAWLEATARPPIPLTESDLLDYTHWLKQRSEERYWLERLRLLAFALLVVRPDGGVAGLQRALNAWRQHHAARRRGRPSRQGNRKPRPKGFGLPHADWPQNERERWETATQRGGKYASCGPLGGYRPSTLKALRRAYALWLGFLDRTDPGVGPTCDAVAAFAAELEGRVKPASAAQILRRARRVLVAFNPGQDVASFDRQARRLAGRRQASPSKLPRLVHPGDLVRAGEELLERARRALRTRKAALDFRDGLLLILLAFRPARIGNVSMIRHGVELDLAVPQGHLSWTAEQTKNRLPLSLPLNPALVALISEYWNVYRPLLVGSASTHLWIGRYGNPLSVCGLQQIVSRRTKELLGKSVPPHLFRDCLATMIATERPERIDDVGALLGQRAPRSKDTYIALARSLIAQRRRQDLEVQARKERGRPALRFHR
jgi:integrase